MWLGGWHLMFISFFKIYSIERGKKMKNISKVARLLTIISLTIILMSGCARMGPDGSRQRSNTGWGAGIGAGTGAILGQVIGENTESTLIGGGLGALFGGILGNRVGAYMDSQQRELEKIAVQSDLLSLRRTEDVLHATFRGRTMFAYDSATLLPGASVEIQRVARILAQFNQTMVMVAGHTDTQGDAAYNMGLSEARANAVKTVLIQYGAHPARIQTIGYGESQPISSNHAMNRRVELILTPITK